MPTTPDTASTATACQPGRANPPEARTTTARINVTKTCRIRLKWNAPSARIASEAMIPVVAQQVAVPSAASSWIGKAMSSPSSTS